MAERVIGQSTVTVNISLIVCAVAVLSNYSTLRFLKVFMASLKVFTRVEFFEECYVMRRRV